MTRKICNTMVVLSGIVFLVHLPIVANSYSLAHRLARKSDQPDPKLWMTWSQAHTQTADQAFFRPKMEGHMHFAEFGLLILAASAAVGSTCLLLGRRCNVQGDGES